MTRYDPEKHHRRSIRLPGYDYASSGVYFVTICAHQKEQLFGAIAGDTVTLNPLGQIVDACWYAIPEHFPHAELDAFVVMPNHVHGILAIYDTPTHGAKHASPLPTLEFDHRPHGMQRGSLSAIVASFKSAATRRINSLCETPGVRVWQRNYYEHIIRNDAAWNKLRQYIMSNPARWRDDEYY
jgi:REP element-mobilizing transposase RayT